MYHYGDKNIQILCSFEITKRKKIATDEIYAWRQIERIYAKTCNTNKTLMLFIAEAKERHNTIKNEAKMRNIMTKYIDKFVLYDMNFDDYDDADNELYMPPCYIDIWDMYIKIIYFIFYVESQMEKYKLNQRINKLKNELDYHYGEMPDSESAASLCKITEFGYERAEELQVYYNWRECETKKIKDTIVAINVFYRETKY